MGIYKYNENNTPLPKSDRVEGDIQKGIIETAFAKEIITEKQIIDLTETENMKQDYRLLKETYGLLDTPIILTPSKATFDEIAIHALKRQRLSPETVEKRMRYARFMETHQCPVDFRNPTFENFIRHMDYREQVQNATADALIHQWKTMKTILKAYGIPVESWPYRAPSTPKSKKRYIPLPEEAYALVHNIYSEDDYENALVQYSLCHDLIIGWRNPSEPCAMTTGDINLDDGTITITEPKKNNSTRTLVPEYSIVSGKNRKSFKYWLDHWRPKVENQHSGNALYLRPNGFPIEPIQYGAFMRRAIKTMNTNLKLYSTRHFCAIGLLIREKINTGHWNIYAVMNHLGHDNPDNTMKYIRDAEQYIKLAPYDWFQRVLKATKNGSGENRLKSVLWPIRGVLNDITSREQNGPAQAYQSYMERIKPVLCQILGVLEFKQTIKSLFSFFNDVGCPIGC